MYGYRKASKAENALMTNLNSISSSLSSIDTIARSTTNHRSTNNKLSSNDNLISSRSHSIASTSLLWPTGAGYSNKNSNDRYANGSTRNNYSRYQQQQATNNSNNQMIDGSEIYYSMQANTGQANAKQGAKLKPNYLCFKGSSKLASNFLLFPLLLLTIFRQVFDFLGQIWLQILINFFTILLLIVALFGLSQRRISYLLTYSIWALFNAIWNLIVICIYFKLIGNDANGPSSIVANLNEDFLSLYTNSISWWHINGPGCLPYNLTSIQPSIGVQQASIITGCRLDYHSIEAAQALLHAILAFVSSISCCCLMAGIRRNPKKFNTDKLYRLSTLPSERPSKVNPDPFPTSRHRIGSSSAYGTHSLRRAPNKTGSRSSQHSVSSQRSAAAARRNRLRQPNDSALPTPRGSTSSAAQRSQNYGSLSSRRSVKKEARRAEAASLTYGSTGAQNGERLPGSSGRARLSSVSSNDYLPSYQPPHSSSSANLLNSYGDISSIDSYNNHVGGQKRPGGSRSNRQASIRTRGNTNPTYAGSRSSIYSAHGVNQAASQVVNNYDDLSYVYGESNGKASESVYGGASTSAGIGDQQPIYQKSKFNSIRTRNGYGRREPPPPQVKAPQEIHAETYSNGHQQLTENEAMTRAKLAMANGTTFQSFSSSQANYRASNNLAAEGGGQQLDMNNNNSNNNFLNSNYEENNNYNKRLNSALNHSAMTNGVGNGHATQPFDRIKPMIESENSSSVIQSSQQQQHLVAGSNSISNQQPQIYTNQRPNQPTRHPIYTNHTTQSNGNSETPI